MRHETLKDLHYMEKLKVFRDTANPDREDIVKASRHGGCISMRADNYIFICNALDELFTACENKNAANSTL